MQLLYWWSNAYKASNGKARAFPIAQQTHRSLLQIATTPPLAYTAKPFNASHFRYCTLVASDVIIKTAPSSDPPLFASGDVNHPLLDVIRSGYETASADALQVPPA